MTTRSIPVVLTGPRWADGSSDKAFKPKLIGYYVTDEATEMGTTITLYDVEPPCATKAVRVRVGSRWTTDERGRPARQPCLFTTVTPNILRKFKNFRPLV